MSMKVIKSIPEMLAWTQTQNNSGFSVGFVPTMGYLHEGHLSLIREAQKHAKKTVVSIYVNPTQFAPGEDLDAYPRDFERDEQLCAQQGVDAVFYPSDEEMYRPQHKTYVITEELSAKLCGRTRPTHFRGVTTIVAKLFNIVQPQVAVFGQKDAQQAVIIRRMVEDLNFPVRIITAPIVREADGLAMSSRNKYLSAKERQEAVFISKSLELAQKTFANGERDLERIRRQMETLLQENTSARIDYIEFTDAETLGDPKPHQTPVLLAMAVYFGTTRLIDNTILK